MKLRYPATNAPAALLGRINTIFAGTVAVLFLSAASNHAWAEASAIAYGNGGSEAYGWATRATQQEANKLALETCNKNEPKGCVLDSTKAVVRAEGGGKVGFGKSSVSLADGRKNALQACGNKKCKVVFELTEPGFYSLSKPEADKQGNQNLYLAHEGDDSDEQDKAANKGCEKLTGQKCRIVWSGAIAGTYKIASALTPSRSTPASDGNCRPNTPTLRCASTCSNGNCIVTYENGCKMRVQVRPNFDSFTNQWVYPSPSC